MGFFFLHGTCNVYGASGLYRKLLEQKSFWSKMYHTSCWLCIIVITLNISVLCINWNTLHATETVFMSAVRGEGIEDIVSLYGAGGMGPCSLQITAITNASWNYGSICFSVFKAVNEMKWVSTVSKVCYSWIWWGGGGTVCVHFVWLFWGVGFCVWGCLFFFFSSQFLCELSKQWGFSGLRLSANFDVYWMVFRIAVLGPS